MFDGSSVLVSRLFIEALNAYDLGTLAALVSEEVEFPNPAGGRSLHGRDGLERVVHAAGEAGVTLARRGAEQVASTDGVTRITTRVVEHTGTGLSIIHGTAVFEIADRKISAFEVSSELLRR